MVPEYLYTSIESAANENSAVPEYTVMSSGTVTTGIGSGGVKISGTAKV